MSGDDRSDARAVLRRRAQALARIEDVGSVEAAIRVAVLEVGGERYAVDIENVQEFLAPLPITPVPGTPDRWAGVANVRGELYAVLGLNGYFGLSETSDAAKVVLLRADDSIVGVCVDDIVEIRSLAVSDIGPAMADGPQRVTAVRGVAPGPLTVLDVE